MAIIDTPVHRSAMLALYVPEEFGSAKEYFPTEPDWGPAFLAELARTGSVRKAARAVGIRRSVAYARRRVDHWFAGEWGQIPRNGHWGPNLGEVELSPLERLVLRRLLVSSIPWSFADFMVLDGGYEGRGMAAVEPILKVLAQVRPLIAGLDAVGWLDDGRESRIVLIDPEFAEWARTEVDWIKGDEEQLEICVECYGPELIRALDKVAEALR